MTVPCFKDIPGKSADNEYYRFNSCTKPTLNDAGYCLAINWNVDAIACEKEANGFIVQEVAITTDYRDADIVKPEHYLEAWKVERGLIVQDSFSEGTPDDLFSLAPNGELFPFAIGQKGFVEYQIKVYWVPSDAAKRFRIENWREGAVRSANELKSIQFDEFAFQDDLKRHLRFTRSFRHEFDLTNPDEAATRLIRSMSHNSPAKDVISESILLDAVRLAKKNPIMVYAIASCLKECPDWFESRKLLSAICELQKEDILFDPSAESGNQ